MWNTKKPKSSNLNILHPNLLPPSFIDRFFLKERVGVRGKTPS
jgi:hypothetical protein